VNWANFVNSEQAGQPVISSRRRSVEVDIDDLVDTLESVALDANGAARILDGARALTDPAAAAAQSPSSDPGFDARATAPRTKSTG
jgi:hypothetical protein